MITNRLTRLGWFCLLTANSFMLGSGSNSGNNNNSDANDASPLDFTRTIARFIESIPVYSSPADQLLAQKALTRWEVPPVQSPECVEFYHSNPALKERYQSLNKTNAISIVNMIPDISFLTKLTNNQFMCLFSLGYVPTRVIQGIAQGRVYDVFGENVFNDLAHIVWGGKIFAKSKCNSTNKEINLVVNSVMKYPGFFALANVSNNPINTAHKFSDYEKWDDKGAVWIDYSSNLAQLCENELPKAYDVPEFHTRLATWATENNLPMADLIKSFADHISPDSPIMETLGLGRNNALRAQKINFDMFNNLPSPIYVVDALRWIGRDEDKLVDYYLGRVFLTFAEGLRTVGWYNLKSTDVLSNHELY